MRNRGLLAAALWAIAASAGADEVRDVEENGVTYREVHRKISEPVTEYQCMDQQRTTGFREQVNVQMCDQTRSYIVPVTEYRLEARWRGRYNPFVQPYLAQHLVPYTRYETRVESVKVPVTSRQLLPITSTVRVPVPTQRVVERDVVISRVAISGSPAQAPRQLASDPFVAPAAQKFGGLENLAQTPKWNPNTNGASQSPALASRPQNPTATIRSKPQAPAQR
ncbi:MAG TPA: hypothetical protein VN699_21715 [Pirellulales bacterium]|nr:hypothetical protein [Pirellulales bacterium]